MCVLPWAKERKDYISIENFKYILIIYIDFICAL
jgi:hypothetical protein